MNTKAHKRRQLAEKKARFSRKHRGNKLTKGRRNFVGSTVPTIELREKANLVIATLVTGSLWVASLWVIAGVCKFRIRTALGLRRYAKAL